MIKMNLGANSYNIEIKRGGLLKASQYLNLDRKVMIITDEGVPIEYAEKIAEQCKIAYIKVVPQGEGSKSFQMTEEILKDMLEFQFTRKDCVVAVGGGMVGDLSGFVASLYMRGIDFYNVPTTLLSQVDSSIGGKTAINLAGFKNMVGAFYQPKAVLIDSDTLNSLSERQLINGLMESVKMGMTNDKELVDLCREENWKEYLDEIVEKSLLVKKYVVEEDEKESHLRKILNFGHTIGHGFESVVKGKYLHGECVAMGMLYMCSDNVKEELLKIYKNLGFDVPDEHEFQMDRVKEAVLHDKKASAEKCSVVYVSEVGKGSIEEWDMDTVLGRLEQ